MDICRLSVRPDESTKDVPLFAALKRIHVSKPELFKHGIMMWDRPDGIRENDFEHFQSKVPALEQLLGDDVEIEATRIINKGTGDRTIKLASEVIGVGCGLIYAIAILRVNPKDISKVPPPQVKPKTSDYSVKWGGADAELEVKGTISDATAVRMLGDIDDKKRNSQAALKFGTVTVARRPTDGAASYLVVRDDPPLRRETV